MLFLFEPNDDNVELGCDFDCNCNIQTNCNCNHQTTCNKAPSCTCKSHAYCAFAPY